MTVSTRHDVQPARARGLEMRHFPRSWQTRNLMRFCRHPAHESLDDAFAANFSFRDRGSRFSVLKDYRTAPGPDACYATYDIDSRSLFRKLLGLEMEFPGLVRSRMQETYNSMNFYRSHIEEVFFVNGVRPLPPIEGACTIFYPETDCLAVTYVLRNTSAVPVTVRLRWFSEPEPHARCQPQKSGFSCDFRQKVITTYKVFVSVATTEPGLAFARRDGRLVSNWIPRTLPPRARFAVTFTVALDYHRPPRPRLLPARASGPALLRSVRATEAAYARLPPLPKAFQRFESLALKAVGAQLTLRYRDRDEAGHPVMTAHSGKCGLAATWFWDTGFSLLGTALAGDRECSFGMARLMLDGIEPDGRPPLRREAEHYRIGYQQPILAWGIDHVLRRFPNQAFLRSAYAPLARYVRHWLTACDANGNGLAEYPAGGTCWDDSLRWQDRFPVAFRRGETWSRKRWGDMRPELFENVDTNTHLYLECATLARFAAALGLDKETRAWRLRASTLRRLINRHLFNPVDRVYQDRCIEDGRFTGMVTPGSFMPLYAGIAPKSVAVDLCRRYLLNPDRFYTTMPFPTLDRAHPAFRSGGGLGTHPDKPGSLIPQAYWIGRSWPHVSYWMVGALHRSGLEQEADRAAQDTLDAMGRSEAIYECYDSLTGTGAGHPECLWSAAAAIALALQYYKRKP